MPLTNIRREPQQDDGDRGRDGDLPSGYTVDPTLANCSILPLDCASFGSLYTLSNQGAVTLTFYGCNDPNGKNNTFLPLYDDTGTAVTMTMPNAQCVFKIPDAALCCRAIKIVTSGSAFKVTKFTKG